MTYPFSVEFFQSQLPLRISFTIEEEMQKCLDISLGLENRELSRNLCRTGANLAMG
jgi:hypothetical protein